MAQVVTRFAPSPTGHLHVGGARTALFNWALARGGAFLLRIEDTDRARSTDVAAAGILEDLAWLGILWDEGPKTRDAGGDPRAVGPFFQSQRLGLYREAIEALIDVELAYPAFETPEELDALRRDSQREKRAFRYRRSPDFDRDVALARRADHEHVIRFRMPEDPVRVSDAVLGEIAFGEEHLDDFVILKRDGFPTYHLAVVVDDAAMGVTHVLRGQEHLNNTPRHVALQRALGVTEPVFVHLPLIFNLDGSKMSKRDKDKVARQRAKESGGDVSVEAIDADVLKRWIKDKRSQLDPPLLAELATALDLELPSIEVEDFRRAGYLPEVLCNYLALLGWNPGEKDVDGKDLERFDREFFASRFDLTRVGKSNAKFDRAKLEAFNADTIAETPDPEFVATWTAWCERYDPEALEVLGDRVEAFAAAMKPRSKTLADPTRREGPGRFALVRDDTIDWDAGAVAKVLQKGEPSGLERLRDLEGLLEALERFSADSIEAAVGGYCDTQQIGMGEAAQPLRVAVAGRTASPGLGETLAILGRESVMGRIARCIKRFA
jgi:glutamyl-tRNA synthetase